MVVTSCHLIVCSFIYQSIYDSVLNTSGVILKENQKVRRNGKVDVSEGFQTWYLDGAHHSISW